MAFPQPLPQFMHGGLACKYPKSAYNVGKCGKSGKKWGKVGNYVDNCGFQVYRETVLASCS